MTPREKKDKSIAAAITFAVVLLILLVLFIGGMEYQRSQLAETSRPELMLPEDEEQFLEPEILRDLGEKDAVNHDSPAPAFKGEPEKAETDNNRLVVPGKNPKPAPPTEKLVSTTKENELKTTEPKATDEEKQKVTSKITNSFSGRNGATDGTSGTSGAGGTGTGISGTASGRSFIGCPTPNVSLRNKTVVKVSVVIDAEGKVISASASGGASAEIRRACEQAARGARWSAKKGASETRGTITFTIYPK